MVGVNIGFGKRLNWPDDYFTFTAELGYTGTTSKTGNICII